MYMSMFTYTDMCTRTYKHTCTPLHMYTHFTPFSKLVSWISLPPPPHPSYICHMTLCAYAVVLYPRIIPVFSGMTKKPMPR